MNVFVGVGRIKDVKSWSKVLSFGFVIQQAKPTYVPCVTFDTSEKTEEYLIDFETSGKLVWLQGRLSSHEFEIIPQQGISVKSIGYHFGIPIYLKKVRIFLDSILSCC